MSAASPIVSVYISPRLKTLRGKGFINVWRGYPGNWICHPYKKSKSNRRRAAQLQAALSERETRQAAEAA